MSLELGIVVKRVVLVFVVLFLFVVVVHLLLGGCCYPFMHSFVVKACSSYFNYNFNFGPFWTHKIKTKAKYISISNTLHLLSTAGPVPCVEPFPASFVVDSSTLVSFSVDSKSKFDC